MEITQIPLADDIQRSIDAQQRAEARLGETMGKSFQERLLIIRQAINNNKDMTEPDYRQEDKLMGFLPTPTPEQIVRFMPQLAEVIDGMYRKITSTEFVSETEKELAIFDLIGATYCLGMLIHPFFDGNRRTFTTLVLSYLHELKPETADYSFRYKTDKTRLDADPFHDIISDNIYKGILVNTEDYPTVVQEYLDAINQSNPEIGMLNRLERNVYNQGYNPTQLHDYRDLFEHSQIEVFLSHTLQSLNNGEKTESTAQMIDDFRTRFLQGSVLQPKQIPDQDINPFA